MSRLPAAARAPARAARRVPHRRDDATTIRIAPRRPHSVFTTPAAR